MYDLSMAAFRQTQLAKKNSVELVIVMLSRMDNRNGNPAPLGFQNNRSGLDNFGACAQNNG
jgi:hypothetical protein